MEFRTNQKLGELVSRALREQVETRLTDLFDTLSLDPKDPALTKVEQVCSFCEQFRLELVPGVDRGALDTVRCLRPKDISPRGDSEILVEISQPESTTRERKSSLWFDRKKFHHNPGISHRECKSEEVLHASLKTVAAFLNTDGGSLYLGVSDDGQSVGIADDLLLLKHGRQDPDNWELSFREHIKADFYEGSSVNDYIRMTFHSVGNACVVRVLVSKRTRLAFVKYKNNYVLYRRQGNRTEEVPIQAVEDFVDFRNRRNT